MRNGHGECGAINLRQEGHKKQEILEYKNIHSIYKTDYFEITYF